MPPRRQPDRPLPPYAYVPGKSPHPLSDPQGHMFGQQEQAAAAGDPWWQNESWLWGFDLFHHGYYWEAHEAWENLWISVGRRGPAADLIKGLIKLAAAGVKAREGKPEGVRRHARRAEQLFAQATASAESESFPVPESSVEQWRKFARRVEQKADDLIDTRDEKVVIVFPWNLLEAEET